MEKILTKEILLEKSILDLQNAKQFEDYSFSEKLAYQNCLNEIMQYIQQLEKNVLKNNLQFSQNYFDKTLKIKNRILILKELIL